MGAQTGIEWCHHTWSPWRGCQKVSDGCTHCYAETLAKRNPAVLGEWGPGGKRVVAKDWDAPRRWDRAAARAGERRRVFPSLCDWLEDRPELTETRKRFMELIQETPNLDWLLLTKRPEFLTFHPNQRFFLTGDDVFWSFPSNVWHGVSVEDQKTADVRIPVLLETPAAVRWVSYEPALGPVDFTPWLDRLDWIVVGGESGPSARPFNVQWAWDVLRQTGDGDTPAYIKQLGANPFDSLYSGDVAFRDPKGGDPEEWPRGLRVREFPEVPG